MGIDWKETLATVAPTIATALGGPMAGVAVSMAAKALGLPVGSSQDALEAAVAAGDPAALAALKKVDNDFKVQMKQLGVDLAKINAGDRFSARLLGVERGVAVQAGLSAVFGFAFALILWQLFSGEEVVHSNMKDTGIYALGTLNGILIQIMNFWFGSSEGSKTKTKIIGDLEWPVRNARSVESAKCPRR